MNKIITILSLIGFYFSNTYSLSIIPMSTSIIPGEKNSFQYRIENKSDDLMAFELSLWIRDQDKNGNDILIKVNKLAKNENPKAEEIKFKDLAKDLSTSLIIYPQQIIIPPHTQRSVKVQYLGKAPEKEIALRVQMSQFPINLAKKAPKDNAQTATINIRYEIWASLYITPKEAKPNVKLEYSANENYITLHNEGNAHAEIFNLALMDNGTLIRDMIDPSEAQTVILAGNTRIYHKKKNKSKIETKASLSKKSN